MNGVASADFIAILDGPDRFGDDLRVAASAFFSSQTHLKVDFGDLLADPRAQVLRISEYLGLQAEPAWVGTAERSIRTEDHGTGDGGQPRSPVRKVLLDLGTHHGEGLQRLQPELSLDETWEIHAFEPNPACEVRRRLQDLPLPVQVHEAAVWIRDGQAAFRQHRQSGASGDEGRVADGWGSCLAELGSCHPGLEPGREVRCEDFARILEGYMAGDHIVVKMDIEGAEFAVLRHLIQRGVVTLIRRLYVEWHEHVVPAETRESRRDLERQLRNHGVEVLPWD